MTRLTSYTAMMIAVILLMPAAHAQQGEWHVAGSVVYNDDDGDRNTDDSLSGVQFNVGWNWTEYVTVEGLLGYSKIDGWTQTALEIEDENHLDLSANILAFYDREAVFAPYVMVGIGYLNTSYDEGTPIQFSFKPGEDGGSVSYTAGLGFKWRLGDSKLSIRGEYRARQAADPKSLTDMIGTIGLEYSFGGRTQDVGIPQSDKPTDTDGDGVLDMWDECSNTPKGVNVTARGCEIRDIDRDSDNDRVLDSRDKCPNTPTGVPVDLTGCSLDSDRDGVTTDRDRCPGTRIGAVVDRYGCESDDDRDGVVNSADRCPNTRSRAKVDENGCEIRDVISLPGVNFQSGSDMLLDGAESLIQEIATTLNANEYLKIEVAGHTDSQGAEIDNQGLSDRRAKTVYDFLIMYGVDENRLTFRGYGESQPIADNETAGGRATNRRVELRVLRN